MLIYTIKTSYVSELKTTHLVKQDDVGMTNANGTDADIPIAITDITTNGSAKDINQVYTVINEYRCDISNKLKDIVNLVNDGLDDYKRGVK